MTRFAAEWPLIPPRPSRIRLDKPNQKRFRLFHPKIKRIKTTEKRTLRNKSARSAVRTLVTKCDTLLKEGKKKEAGEHDLRIVTIFTYASNEEDTDATGMLPGDMAIAAEPQLEYKYSGFYFRNPWACNFDMKKSYLTVGNNKKK